MTEGTRGEGRKGPGHSSEALTGFRGVDGKVLILKILGNIQIQRQSQSSPYGDLLLKASFSRDINLGQIRVQGCANSFAATSLCLSRRSMMRLGNKIFGEEIGGVYASLTIQGLSDRFRLEVPAVLIASA